MADHVTTQGSLQTVIHESADVVSKYQHYVHYIGTSEDTPMFREKLHQERQLIGNMLQALSAQLEQDGRNRGDAEKAAEYAKLAKELAAIFRIFQDAKRLEAKQEAFYVPVVLQQASLFTSRSKTNEAGINADQNSNLHDLLEKLKGMKALLLESENSLKEILRDGEEDEDEVHRIQGEINSLKAFINDYESLTKEQAHGTDDIESSQQVSNVHQTLKRKNTIVRRYNLSFLDCFCQIFGPCFLSEP